MKRVGYAVAAGDGTPIFYELTPAVGDVEARSRDAAANDVIVTLTPTAPADLGVFVVSDCATPSTCVGFQDSIGGGQVSQVAPGAMGLPAGDYWVYVDSYYATGASSCGNYTMSVMGAVPVELMEFTVD